MAGSEDKADPRSTGAAAAASWDVVTAVRPASASTTTPGLIEPFAGCNTPDADIPWPIGDSVVVIVDSLTLDGAETDDRGTAPLPDDDTPVLFPGAAASADELDVEAPESDGVADAAHGVVPRAAQMPRATANAPTRPIQLAHHISRGRAPEHQHAMNLHKPRERILVDAHH
jgi:hypothetical protein